MLNCLLYRHFSIIRDPPNDEVLNERADRLRTLQKRSRKSRTYKSCEAVDVVMLVEISSADYNTHASILQP